MKTISRYLKCAILSSVVLFLISFPVLASAENKLNPAIPLLLLEDSTDDSHRLYDLDEVVETALNSLGEDDSIGAVFLAMDKGYSLRQIVEGIMSRGLAVNGDIKDTTGAIVTPEYPPLGIIKTNTKESLSQAILVRSESGASEITIGFKELVAKSKTVATKLEHYVKWIVLSLHHMGYSQKQIIEGIMLHTIKWRLREIKGGKEEKAVLGMYDQNGLEIVPEGVSGERVFKHITLGPVVLKKEVKFGQLIAGEHCLGADLYVGDEGDRVTYCFSVDTSFLSIRNIDTRKIRIADSGLLIDEKDMKISEEQFFVLYYETTLDKNLTNCANLYVEHLNSIKLWTKSEDSDCARVYVRKNAEFPYLDARVTIEWKKDVGDLAVAACRDFCSPENNLDPDRDYRILGSFGNASMGIHKSGEYSLAVWIHALKPGHYDDPSVSVTLGLELKPYRTIPTKEGTRKVYGEKTTTSYTIKVAIEKDAKWCFRNWKGYGCKYHLGRFRVIGVEPPG